MNSIDSLPGTSGNSCGAFSLAKRGCAVVCWVTILTSVVPVSVGMTETFLVTGIATFDSCAGTERMTLSGIGGGSPVEPAWAAAWWGVIPVNLGIEIGATEGLFDCMNVEDGVLPSERPCGSAALVAAFLKRGDVD